MVRQKTVSIDKHKTNIEKKNCSQMPVKNVNIECVSNILYECWLVLFLHRDVLFRYKEHKTVSKLNLAKKWLV